MAPKKGQKMSLNDFLVDNTLGSWADEMDALPTAPSMKTDEERARDRDGRRGGDRDFGRDRDFNRDDRGPPREELPLPTKAPYIAFVGNLAFDLFEDGIADFFAPTPLKDIKIIKDRDDKPKGFGYVEFETLDGLKEGLSRSGGQLLNRTVRISVAEPPKSGGFDDDKFAGPWRRDGPLPPLASNLSRPGPGTERFGSRFAGPDEDHAGPGQAEVSNDWRSNRPIRAAPPPSSGDRPGPPPRRGSGFTPAGSDGPPHPAVAEPTWSIGSKFKPSSPSEQVPERKGMFGGRRGDTAVGSGALPEDDSDWRSAPRRTLSGSGSQRGSPTTSTPPTPQLGARRKLELLPRSVSGAATDNTQSKPAVPKSNPFGAAKPVDASSAKEKEIEDRLEQDRLARQKERDVSRSGSGFSRAITPPVNGARSPVDLTPVVSPKFVSSAAIVRPKTSFAAAAANASSMEGDATAQPDAES